jgi:hypothetical protein
MKGPAPAVFLRRVAGQTRVLLLVTFVLGGYLILGLLDDVGAQTSIDGTRVLLVSPADEANSALAPSINELRASGFNVTSDVQQALFLTSQPEIAAFIVTRQAFPSVPASAWADLYDKGVLIGGLDVSLHELWPLADPGRKVGEARLRYTPLRPIFSILYAKGCREGAMPDWLDAYNISAVINLRLAELSTTQSSSGDQTCLP